MERLKIAYIMHVDWAWIKQRPHFIAEELRKKYIVDIFWVKNFRNELKLVHKGEKKKGFHFIKVPFSARSKLSRYLEKLINKRLVRKLKNEKYDIIWLTSPIIMQFIDLNEISSQIIIYDCMDDALAFNQKEKIKNNIEANEKKLVLCSSVIFTSSNNLKEKLIFRYGNSNNLYTLNNAITNDYLSFARKKSNDLKAINHKKIKKIFYFGTISDWFDFDLLLWVLDQNKEISFTLIGPVDTKIPKHPRIIYVNAVSHLELLRMSEEADAFIMPFKKNELIDSVNPVKLYEYLCFSKPVFTVYYDELKQFEKYVFFFKNKEELLLQIDKSVRSSIESPLKFLEDNTWERKTEEIFEIISQVKIRKGEKNEN
ncbi:hypothetical protein [Paenibacillus polymyxa]|uniref:hypothetical protein n=1 Tax=Paenibacillus polymyxa TaxID=1406 RepID=UPI000C9FF2E2|nr:hypothetical protein [Paenibacillus polymyxa]PNQ85053.1 hypothetical protein C1T20_14930 [Paenibacillus polymyxa]